MLSIRPTHSLLQTPNPTGSTARSVQRLCSEPHQEDGSPNVPLSPAPPHPPPAQGIGHIGVAFSEFNGVGNDEYDDPVRKWWIRLYSWAVGADTLDAQTRDIKYVLGAFDEMQSVGVTKDNW